MRWPGYGPRSRAPNRTRPGAVLSGAGAALVLFMVLNQLGALHLHEFRIGTVEVRESMIYGIRVVGAFAVAGSVGSWRP